MTRWSPLVLLVACASVEPPKLTFELHGECTETCHDESDSCRDRVHAWRRSCTASCFSAACLDRCRETEAQRYAECNDICETTPACRAGDFEALPASMDETLRDACSAAFASRVACGSGPEPEGVCEHYARVESPARVATYECMRAAPCGGVDACVPAPDAATAANVCSGGAACGGECGEAEGALAELLPWVDVDVFAALQACAARSCIDGRVQCVQAWLDAVTLQ